MKFFLAFAASLFLVACSGPELPMERPEPLAVNKDSLVRPPWEALVKAGPDADKDIDLETLNGPLTAPAEPPVVAQVEPDLPVEPEPAPAPAIGPKPGDAVIKAVAVLPVKGVGGAELTSAMRKVLKDAGWSVLADSRKDALNIQGSVALDPAQNGQQVVHLVWVVTTPQGKNLGDIKQNNPVPAGSLDKGWGENAGFATQAAATGIFELIDKFR